MHALTPLTLWQETLSNGRMIESITKGRGNMPAFVRKISGLDIKALSLDVRHLKK
ncbi:MAG: hypothetical protein QOC96_1464 [Acidobacteriota bacterium]|jgi:hypothetical protein|nr:hypothetical protein [Acidobacteriota bacterium]